MFESYSSSTALAPFDFDAYDRAHAPAPHEEPAPMSAAPIPEPEPPPPTTSTPAAHAMRTDTAAVRVGFTWFGTKKTLDKSQRQEAADTFGAEGGYVSAGKKLVDTRHPHFRAVTKVRGEIVDHWREQSLPFPEPGMRLIKREDIGRFNERMTEYREELTDAVRTLDAHFYQLREEARARLGRLFDPADYPADLTELFAVSWDFPNVEPPDYLMQLNPAVYEAERARVAAQFDDAVRLAQEAFTEELRDLITHLCDRITKGEDGERRTFRDTTVNNLHDFFDRFRRLNFHSSTELDDLVNRAQQAIRGASPNRLRTSEPLRESVAAQLGAVSRTLESMTTAPRRRISRDPRPAAE